MKVSGDKIKRKVLEYSHFQLEMFILVIFKKIKSTAKADVFLKTVIRMQGNGIQEKVLVRAAIFIKMVEGIKDRCGIVSPMDLDS